jgi:hypothetical protein
MPRPFPSLARHSAAAGTLALVAALAPAAAQPAFDFNATPITARRLLYGSVVDEDVALATPLTPALVSVLHEFGISRFPTSGSALPRGYASAVMTGTGFGGVGVSFISGGTPDYASVARLSQTITNIGNMAGALEANFDIPRIEASIFAGPSYGTFPAFARPQSYAGARLTATRFAPDGTQLSRTTVFDYYLRIERIFQGDDCESIHEITVSDDLAARLPGGVLGIEQGDVCGIASVPFGGTVALGTLAPAERLVVEYELRAENLASASRTPELGYQALVGDPFGISGGGGLAVRPAAVPEPATAALLGTALAPLAALAAHRARRRPSPFTRIHP